MKNPNTNTSNSSKLKVDVTIKGVTGKVMVLDVEGVSHSAKPGMQLDAGNQVIVKGSSAAVLGFGDLGEVTLGHDQVLTIDDQLIALLKTIGEEGSLEDGVNFDALQQAIVEGRSLEEVLPATASGDVEPVSSDGSSVGGLSRFELTGQEVTPESGFETGRQARSVSADEFEQNTDVSQDYLLRVNNSQPETAGIATISVDEDSSVLVDLSGSFSDADSDQTLRYDISGLPEGFSFDPSTGEITGTPTNDDALNNGGIYPITVTATDDSGAENNSVSTSFDLQVVNINDAPTIEAPIDLGSIDEDGSIVFSVEELLEGSSDIDLDPLSVSNLAVVNGDGELEQIDATTYRFTPTENWNGETAFSYVVTDGNGGEVSNQVALTVNPVNDAPVALADGPMTTPVNTGFDVQVLGNDTDVDGDTLTTMIANAEHGQVVINNDSSLTYTPDTDYFGDDLITYQVDDGNGGTAEATIGVSVTYAAGVISIDDQVLVNDTPTFSGTSTNILGDLSLEINGASYVVTPEADGSWSFTIPDADVLPDGEYTVTVSGLDELDQRASVSDDVRVDENAPEVSIDNLDVIDTATPVFSGSSQNTDGDFTLNVNGVDYSVTPDADGSWSFALPIEHALGDGEYTASISAEDAAGNQASDQDDFVVDVNDPLVSIDDQTISDTNLPTFSGSSSYTDGPLELTVNGQSYEVTPNSDGTWSFTLPVGAELGDGAYTATILGRDNQGNQAEASDDFVVDAIDDASIINGDVNGSVDEADLGDLSQVSGALSISDPDTGVQPTFEDASYSGNYGQLELVAGTWTYTLDQSLVQNLDAGDILTDLVPVVASNGAVQEIEITINGTNDEAVIVGDFSGSVVEADIGDVSSVTGSLSISDVDDADMPVFENTTIAGAYGELQLTDGMWEYQLDQSLVQGLAQGQQIVDAITSVATDGSSQQILITITGTNDGPVASSAVVSTEENTTLNASVPAATDVDGSIASYALVDGLAVGEGSLVFNADGGYRFDPGTDFDGLAVGESREVSFTYRATDNDGAESSIETITITVNGSNDGPVASSTTASTEENTVLNGNVPAATDVDGSIVSYALVNGLGAGEGTLVFNADGGYSFDPGVGFDDLPVGTSRDVSFTYRAIDNDGGESSVETVTITVTGTNDAPVAQNATVSTLDIATVNGSVPAASDVDGTIASYALRGDVSEGTLSFLDDGSYTFTPGSDFDDLAVGESRDVEFTYVAIDSDGAESIPVSVTITVTGGGEAPELSVSDGNLDTSFLTISVPFSEEPFPDLPGSSPADANGLDSSGFQLNGPAQIDVSFIRETASNNNTIGWYRIDDSGVIRDVGVIWKNGNDIADNDTQTLVTDSSGEIGFFLTQNGYASHANIFNAVLNGNGLLRFEDADRNMATKDTDGSRLVYYSEGTQDDPSGFRLALRTTYHSNYSNLNDDGLERVTSGVNGTDTNTLIIGFEDFTDWDLRDFVFSVNISSIDKELADIDPSISVTDDGISLTAASAQIVSGRVDDELFISSETQSLADSYGISYDYNNASKTLSLFGEASLSEYQEVLSSIQLASNSSIGDTPREISFQVTDTDGLTSTAETVTLNGGVSYDFSGNDVVVADGIGDIIGGQGDDILIASGTTDVFVWRTGDQGSVSEPAVDKIQSFTTGLGGDVLDLSDLLQGESASALSLDDYLDFSSDGSDTTIQIDPDANGSVTQTLVIEGVDLTVLGTDQQILQQLLSDGNIVTD